MFNNKGYFLIFCSGVSRFLQAVRAIFLNLITLLVLIFLLLSIGAVFTQKQPVDMPESGALRIAIEGSLVDQKTRIDPLDVLLNEKIPSEILVYELVQAINMAAQDTRINSITLVLDGLENTGPSKIAEVGRAIMRFRETGKPVIAIADEYGQNQYLLASYADRILMNPMGVVELAGYSSYQNYLAEALAKLKVQVNVFRTGPHKSAVEPLIAKQMSPESKEQAQWLVDSLWAEYQQGLLSRRKIDEQRLQKYSHSVDQLLVNTGLSLAELALELNLVDALLTRDQILDEIQALAGQNETGDFYLHTNAMDYYHANQHQLDKNKPRVGYLAAKGQIVDGVQPSGLIGGDSLAFQLKNARLNENLKALVLRVDSPGGSAFASEVIRRELALYKQANIPIVVSMGSVAASGGYWISIPADEIWATPTTITGSIGVFAVVPTFDKSLNSVGIYTDGVATTPLAGAFRLDRPLSEQVKRIYQSQVDHLNNDFLSLVSTGRNIPLEQLKPLTEGRVWTGKQALENGLIDHLGDQFDAIQSAAKLAGLGADYQVHKLEPQLNFGEQLFKDMLDQVVSKLNIGSISWLRPLADLLTAPASNLNLLLSDPQHMYLHCENCPIDL